MYGQKTIADNIKLLEFKIRTVSFLAHASQFYSKSISISNLFQDLLSDFVLFHCWFEIS